MIPREVFESTVRQFFAPVVSFFDDPTVTEILINGPDEVIVERKGQLEPTTARFADREDLCAAVRHLAQFVGRRVDAESPILEGRLPDGSRVEAILPPASPDGPHVAIRRFFKETLTIGRLIEFGLITPDAVELISALVGCKQNILVAGGTGSGKTSLLGAISSFIGERERVVVIEDARELQLQRPHVVHFESQPPDARGRGRVTIRDLFKATLRMRPDRIVVGEIRSGEALDLVQAMTSGHGGCLSTVHATYPADTLSRLETMALMSDVEIPLVALRSQIASAIDIVVQTSRMADGSRTVTHITDVLGLDPSGGYQLQDLYVRRVHGRGADGCVHSTLERTGAQPRCRDRIDALATGTTR